MHIVSSSDELVLPRGRAQTRSRIGRAGRRRDANAGPSNSTLWELDLILGA